MFISILTHVLLDECVRELTAHTYNTISNTCSHSRLEQVLGNRVVIVGVYVPCYAILAPPLSPTKHIYICVMIIVYLYRHVDDHDMGVHFIYVYIYGWKRTTKLKRSSSLISLRSTSSTTMDLLLSNLKERDYTPQYIHMCSYQLECARTRSFRW